MGIGNTDDPAFTLQSAHQHAIAYSQNTRDEVRQINEDGSIAGALPAEPGMKQQTYVFEPGSVARNAGPSGESLLAPTLRSDMGDNQPAIRQNMQVRRLTPMECERLQGFPDNYSLITYRGKPACDGPRYKAIGNSMAVPVMAWIGKRIQMVEEHQKCIGRCFYCGKRIQESHRTHAEKCEEWLERIGSKRIANA